MTHLLLLSSERENLNFRRFFPGFLDDQREMEQKLKDLNQTQEELLYAPGVVRNDRFRLNNLSFAGPVVMGIGGRCQDGQTIYAFRKMFFVK